jgi:hypothetical protein
MAQTANFDIRPKQNSPYSRFGLGDLRDQYFVAASAMGGISATFQDPFHLNFRNPASLASLRATAFEVGVDAKYASLKGADQKTNNWSGNLNYLALGFPLKNPINEALERRRLPFGLGMGFALQPYSVVGYDVQVDLEGNGAGETNNSFKGSGGTYRLMWGNAARWQDFSVGFNLSYLFGNINNSRRVEFPGQELAYASEFLDKISFSGWLWEFGAQYTYEFKKPNAEGEMESTGKRIIAGVFGSSKNKFQTNTTRFISRDNFLVGARDTVLFEEDIEREGTLPAQMTLGLGFEEVNRLRVGIEYSRDLWNQYRNEARPQELKDTWGVAFGAEYIPDISSYNSYFEKVRYRFGGFYRTDPRTFDAGQLDQLALTLGFGFPIIRPRQQTSFLNVSFEAGQFGHPDIIRETYFKMGLGFTLNDNTWFFKRKFN